MTDPNSFSVDPNSISVEPDPIPVNPSTNPRGRIALMKELRDIVCEFQLLIRECHKDMPQLKKFVTSRRSTCENRCCEGKTSWSYAGDLDAISLAGEDVAWKIVYMGMKAKRFISLLDYFYHWDRFDLLGA